MHAAFWTGIGIVIGWFTEAIAIGLWLDHEDKEAKRKDDEFMRRVEEGIRKYDEYTRQTEKHVGSGGPSARPGLRPGGVDQAGTGASVE